MDHARIRQLATRVVRSFDDGMDRISLFDGDLTLRYAKRGEVISDDLCQEDFEALETGVFQRFTATKDGVDRFVYLRMGALDADIAAHALERALEGRDPSAIEEADVELAFQAVSWRERGSRRKAWDR